MSLSLTMQPLKSKELTVTYPKNFHASPSPLAGMSKEFINNAVQAMYKYEASLTNEKRLLTEEEIKDFYISYKGDRND